MGNILSYKGQVVILEEDQRIGVCNLCRAVASFDCALTQMHHVQYHDDDPLRDTIEVCPSCHRLLRHEGRARMVKNVKVTPKVLARVKKFMRPIEMHGQTLERILDG
jgi:hypothetical protein